MVSFSANFNDIAGSPDGRRIWVTITGHLPGQGKVNGAVLELPAFKADRARRGQRAFNCVR